MVRTSANGVSPGLSPRSRANSAGIAPTLVPAESDAIIAEPNPRKTAGEPVPEWRRRNSNSGVATLATVTALSLRRSAMDLRQNPAVVWMPGPSAAHKTNATSFDRRAPVRAVHDGGVSPLDP